MANSQLLLSFAAVPAGLLSAVPTWAIRPLMRRIALAKPNARSSYRIRTPQGAGVAVIATTLISAAAVIAIGAAMTPSTRVAILLFVIGGIATALLLHRFSRRRPAG